MYRRLLINIYQVRNGLIHTQNTRLPSTKCKERESFVPVIRPTGTNYRPLGTNSSSFSENKKSSTSQSDDKEKRSEENEVKAEVDTDGQSNTAINEGTKLSNALKLASRLKTEPGDKPDDRKGFDKKTTGNDSLLELLRAMKVHVTTPHNKRPKIYIQKHSEQQSKHSKSQNATAEGSKQRETLDLALDVAASAAASTLPNSHQVKSELLEQLKKHEVISDPQRRTNGPSIKDIIADMKVGRDLNGRAIRQIRLNDGQEYIKERSIAGELDGIRRGKNPFISKRLNIFTPTPEQDSLSDLGPTIWDINLANEIVQTMNQIPRNGFEEMIEWTKQGKLWQYPINNEAGLDEEASVPFHEHVFLEKHLDESFPRQGPIRHFMELVITGLAKNYHLTVQQKIEHIAWFRDYFKQKDIVLKEAEA